MTKSMEENMSTLNCVDDIVPLSSFRSNFARLMTQTRRTLFGQNTRGIVYASRRNFRVIYRYNEGVCSVITARRCSMELNETVLQSFDYLTS